MSDPLTQQLSAASFKGVQFFVRSEEQTDNGRRIVLHEYPNSDTRFVEDLGLVPTKFSVDAFVFGENYQDAQRELESVLNEEGPGQLILPTFGGFEAYALPYTVSAGQTEVGEVKFKLSFALGRPRAGPARGPKDIEDVYQLSDTARLSIQSELALAWEIPSVQANITTALFDFSQAVALAADAFRTLLDTGALSDVQKGAAAAALGAASLVRDGQSLANLFVAGTTQSPGIWQAISLGLSNAGEGLDTALRLTRFGSDLTLQISDVNRASEAFDTAAGGSLLARAAAVPLWPETTATRIQRNANRQRIVRAQRLNALLIAYESLAAAQYQTDAQVQAARQDVETAYERLMQVETAARDIIQSATEVRFAVDAVRLAALEVLDGKEQQAFGVTTADYGAGRSAFLAAYDFYAEQAATGDELLRRAVDIRALNPTQPATALSGRTVVLQQ